MDEQKNNAAEAALYITNGVGGTETLDPQFKKRKGRKE